MALSGASTFKYEAETLVMAFKYAIIQYVERLRPVALIAARRNILLLVIFAFTLSPVPARAQSANTEAEAELSPEDRRKQELAAHLNDQALQKFQAGNAQDAEPLYVEALQLRREVLGEKHPDRVLRIRVDTEEQSMKMLPACMAISILSVTAACNDTGDNVGEGSVAQVEGEALDGNAALIANALSAGPNDVTDGATVIDGEGTVLREGSNGWTCIPETPGMGPMCNDETWMAALGAMQEGAAFPTGKLGVSYMLAGEGNAPGV